MTERPTNNTTSETKKKSQQDTHPICQDAVDPEKCEEFVDRLQEAHDNITATDPAKATKNRPRRR